MVVKLYLIAVLSLLAFEITISEDGGGGGGGEEWYYMMGNNSSPAGFSQLLKTGKTWMEKFQPLAFGGRRPGPQFVSFKTKDHQNLVLDLNFAFPFISVPVANTSNIANLARDFMKQERPLINIDLLGIVVTAIITVTSLLVSIAFRTFFSSHKTPSKSSRRADAEAELWTLMETLNAGLKKYGIHSGPCVKRVVCSYVRNSVKAKRSRNELSHWNKIVEGLTRSDWAMDYVAGTELEFAVKMGRSERNCGNIFKKCQPSAWLFKSS